MGEWYLACREDTGPPKVQAAREDNRGLKAALTLSREEIWEAEAGGRRLQAGRTF